MFCSFFSSHWARGRNLFQIHCQICQVHNQCAWFHHFRDNMQNMSGKGRSTHWGQLFYRIKIVRFRFDREKVSWILFLILNDGNGEFHLTFWKVLWEISHKRVSLQISNENIDRFELEFNWLSIRWFGYRFSTRSKAPHFIFDVFSPF